jgi:hypothetical protein
MSQQQLAVPADVVTALADLYWLFPFTKYEASPKRPDKFISRPLAPRPAPRRPIESAARRIGRRIPDWCTASSQPPTRRIRPG